MTTHHSHRLARLVVAGLAAGALAAPAAVAQPLDAQPRAAAGPEPPTRRSCAPSTRASTGARPRSAPAAPARCSCSRLAASRSCRATGCGWPDDPPAETRARHGGHRGGRPDGGRRPGERPSDRPIRRGHRLERECRQGRARRVHLAQRRPAPRVAPLRHDARGHPRRAQCHRPPVASVRVQRQREAREPRPTPRWRRPRATCWSRSSSQLPAPFSQACIDAGVASVEADYTTALSAIPDGRAKTRGVDLGQAAAAAILGLRAADGSDTPLHRPRIPAGHAPGRVALHARPPVRVRARAGERSRRSCSGTARSSVPVRPTR